MEEINALMTNIRHFIERNTLLVERDHIVLFNQFLESKLYRDSLSHIQIMMPEIECSIDARIYQLIKTLNKIGIKTYASCENDPYPGHPVQVVVAQEDKEDFIRFINLCDINPEIYESKVIYCAHLTQEDHDKMLYQALRISLGV